MQVASANEDGNPGFIFNTRENVIAELFRPECAGQRIDEVLKLIRKASFPEAVIWKLGHLNHTQFFLSITECHNEEKEIN